MIFGFILLSTHITEALLIKEDPAIYDNINQGCLTVDNMDDKEEMRLADVCIDPLNLGGGAVYENCQSRSTRLQTHNLLTPKRTWYH